MWGLWAFFVCACFYGSIFFNVNTHIIWPISNVEVPELFLFMYVYIVVCFSISNMHIIRSLSNVGCPWALFITSARGLRFRSRLSVSKSSDCEEEEEDCHCRPWWIGADWQIYSKFNKGCCPWWIGADWQMWSNFDKGCCSWWVGADWQAIKSSAVAEVCAFQVPLGYVCFNWCLFFKSITSIIWLFRNVDCPLFYLCMFL